MGKTEDQVRSIAEKTLGFTDGENGTEKNTVIKNVWRTVSAVALRFPAAFLLGVCNIALICWATQAGDIASKVPCSLLYASGLAIVASASAQLAGERLGCRRVGSLGLQIASIAVFALLSWRFIDCVKFEQHFIVSYYLTLVALVCVLAWLLGFCQRRVNVFTLVLFAGVMSLAAAFCTGAGMSLVLIAVEKLFSVNIHSHIYATVWGGSFAFVGAEFFLAYSTRREGFVPPKAFKVLLVYVAFPIYLVLLAVLWVYFAKCAISWSLPNGQINWLVSLAAAFWMFFHFALAPFQAKITGVFLRFGALALLPPIALQIVALAIRINMYGLTPARYGSILFVVFCLAFSTLSLVRAGRLAEHAYLVLAAIAIFAAHSPWNVVDIGVAAQHRRIEMLYREAGLFKDGKIDPAGADAQLTEAAKRAISEAARFLSPYDRVDGHYRRMGGFWAQHVSNDNFKKKYGFNIRPQSTKSANGKHPASPYYHRYTFEDDGSASNIAGFKSVRYVKIDNHGKWHEGMRVMIRRGDSSGQEGEYEYFTSNAVQRVASRGPCAETIKDSGSWRISLSHDMELVILSLGFSYTSKEDGKIDKLPNGYYSGYGLLLER